MTTTATKTWTQDEVTAALVYIRPIAEQMLSVYRNATGLRTLINTLPTRSVRSELFRQKYDDTMDRLVELNEEIDAVGVTVTSYSPPRVLFESDKGPITWELD